MQQTEILVIYSFYGNLVKKKRSVIGDQLQGHLYIIGGLAVVIEKEIRKG